MKKNEVVLLSVLLLILMLGKHGIGLFGKGKKQTESAPVSTPADTGENAAEATPAPMPEKEPTQETDSRRQAAKQKGR